MKRDMPPAFIKWVCIWSTVCVTHRNIQRENYEQQIHFISANRQNLLKREKKDFSPFNIRKRGCVPSYNKEPLLRPDPSDRPAPASRLLRSCLLFSCLHPKSWHELRVLAESSYSAVLGFTDLAVFAYPYLLHLCPRIFYISSNIICLSLPYFFSLLVYIFFLIVFQLR